MDNRRAARTRKRLACSIELGTGRSSGLILDVSATGLFIQTGAKLDPGDSIILEFEAPGSAEALRVHGRVVRRKSVPVRLQSVVQAGIGIEIVQAPEGYYAMVVALQTVEEKAPSEKPAPRPQRKPTPQKQLSSPKPARSATASEKKQPVLSKLRKRFRVEVHEVDGKGARVVEVEALNAAAAGRKALAEVGDGWKVAGCETA